MQREIKGLVLVPVLVPQVGHQLLVAFAESRLLVCFHQATTFKKKLRQGRTAMREEAQIKNKISSQNIQNNQIRQHLWQSYSKTSPFFYIKLDFYEKMNKRWTKKLGLCISFDFFLLLVTQTRAERH